MKNKDLVKGKKQALGRGLGSLLGNSDVIGQSFEKENNTKSEHQDFQAKRPSGTINIPQEKQIFTIRIDHIHGNKKQPRKVFEDDKLNELALSIAEQGLLQPIVCRKINEHKYEIIAGERRWRASQKAGLTDIPVILKDVDDKKTLELALVENIQRQDLNVIEEAEAFQDLIDRYNLTQQELSNKIGIERVSIANKLRLLKLPKQIRERVVQGEISLGHAKVILSLEEPNDQITLSEKIVKEKLSVRVSEKIAALMNLKNKTKEDNDDDQFDQKMTNKLMKGLSSDMQRSLGTKVKIDYKSGKGKVQLYFYSDEELNRLVDRIKNND